MTTPYFAFCEKERSVVVEELKTSSLEEVNAELGRRWRELGGTQKEFWKKIAAEKPRTEKKPREKSEFNLPLQKIKRICLLSMQEPVKSISKDALILIEQSTELFLQSFAKQAEKINETKTLKEETVSRAIHYGEPKYHFLRHDFQTPEDIQKSKK